MATLKVSKKRPDRRWGHTTFQVLTHRGTSVGFIQLPNGKREAAAA